jgi:hypothetical protein
MRFACFAGALLPPLLGASPAFGQLPENSPGKSEIAAKNVQCGLVASRADGRLAGVSPTGPVSNRKNFHLVEATKEIPAKRGVEFGVIYTLKTYLGTGTTPVRVVFTYPEAGLRNPRTGKTSFSNENTFAKKYDAEQMESYTFEEDWELVPGKWLIQVFDRQKKLAECVFKVMKPKNEVKTPAVRKP